VLHLAAERGHFKVFSYLACQIQNLSINQPNDADETPFMIAVRESKLKFVKKMFYEFG